MESNLNDQVKPKEEDFVDISNNRYECVMSKYGPKSREKEIGLYKAMHAGDESAAHQLALSMAPYIWQEAWQYRSGALLRNDICQEAFGRLVEETWRFDPSKGRYSTFAWHWIHKAMNEAFEKHGCTIATSRGMHRLTRDVHKAIGEFEKRNCRTPSDVELSKFASIPIEDINKAVVYGVYVGPIEDWLVDKAIEDIDAAMDREETYRLLDKALARLDLRTQDILCLKYGFGDCEEMMVKDIAQLFHVSTERVRQIEKEGLEKMKRYLKSYGITSFAA